MLKKRKTISTKTAIERLDRMMPILERNILGAVEIEATMQVGNEIVHRMADPEMPGANAYNVIRRSLSFDLAMHLARLFDKGNRRRHPNDKDAASIPLMIRLLRQKRCRKVYVRRARVANPAMESSFGHSFERGCIDAIERASTAYTGIYKGAFGQSGLKSLKVARDNHFAHSLMTGQEIDLIYAEVFHLAAAARQILENASIAISGYGLDLADKEKDLKDVATQFWERALLSPIAEGQRPF